MPGIDDLFLVSSSEAEDNSRVWYLKVSSRELKKCAKDFPMRFVPIRAF